VFKNKTLLKHRIYFVYFWIYSALL